MRLRIIFVLILIWLYNCEGVILFTQFKTCEDPIIKINASFRTVDGSYQLFNATYISPIINGENLRAKLTAKILVGEMWMPMFALEEERGFCALVRKHTGPFFDNALRGAAIMPRCPIPKGTYLWRNYKPEFEKLRLQFPLGAVKLKITGTEISTGKLAICLDITGIKK
ncbi:hypothetical protein Trydic_g15394 [Trypoxylus dichotomus]